MSVQERNKQWRSTTCGGGFSSFAILGDDGQLLVRTNFYFQFTVGSCDAIRVRDTYPLAFCYEYNSVPDWISIQSHG